MSDAEYNERVKQFLDEMFPQVAKCFCDIGNLNELAMENRKRIEAMEQSK